MARLIAFLSDFGLRDPYVAHVKAVIKRLCPGAEVVDLTHLIDSFCVECGAYIIDSSINWLPEETVFLAVVDPGVGSERKPIIIRAISRWFVGPDNGVLSPVLERDPGARAWVIRPSSLPVGEISSTFHGRDIFGPAAALLSCGAEPDSFGDEVNVGSLARWSLLYERRKGTSLCLRAVYVDKYGNVALSRKSPLELPLGSRMRVSSPSREAEAIYVRTFSQVGEGELALYVNSFGYLEVAVNKGEASKYLGINVGDEVCLTLEQLADAREG